MIGMQEIKDPWMHWIVDEFLTPECLAEVKNVNHVNEQINYGRRVGSQRLFINEQVQDAYPNLYKLYQSLHQGEYRDFFESVTSQSFEGLYPRVEVISDYGLFYLDPHHDHLEKKLTAILYTDYEQLYPGTELENGYRIPVKDNRCFFFVPAKHTMHSYPETKFDKIRRCLQINYWTYTI